MSSLNLLTNVLPEQAHTVRIGAANKQSLRKVREVETKATTDRVTVSKRFSESRSIRSYQRLAKSGLCGVDSTGLSPGVVMKNSFCLEEFQFSINTYILKGAST